MDKSEALKILAKVKANWYRQPTDRVVAREWQEALAPIQYEDAYRAVNAWRDSASPDAPTPGQLASDANEFAKNREELRRAKLLRIEERPTEEQVQRNKGILRQSSEKRGG